MPTTEDIITEAHRRFERSQTYWSQIRERALEDMRFLLADAENEWQWPDWAMASRKEDKRPALTVNRLPQHASQVTNEIRKNPPQAKVRPVDDKADPETAEVFTGLIRHIWANSDATFAIANAAEWQVGGGYGYFRILTEYVDDGSMEQDIHVKPVPDPSAVYEDPGIQLPTGADRKWAFVIEDLPRDDFKDTYPNADQVDWSQNTGPAGWSTEDTIRVAEYYCRKTRKKTLYQYPDGSTGFEPHPFGLKAIASREVNAAYVHWYKLTATEILEERELPDRFIPLVRVVGVEKIVNGERVVKGLVRNAKDAQRMYNLWVTSYAERVNLSPKAPWVGPAGFMDGFEDDWRNANNRNLVALQYAPVVDDNGNVLPGPTRQPPPDIPVGFMQGMMLASDDIKATTGQYDASLGQRSNETSGKAIMARQREGDTGTYHYIDNLAKAVEFASQIIVDIAPKYYDTKRVARILGEDGSEQMAQLDPEIPQSMVQTREDGKIARIYNLGVGRYDVVAGTGPTYTTKQAESADFMAQMVQSDPTLMQKAGDIVMRQFDIPGAEELSKRLKLFLPPNVAEAENEEEGGEMPPQIRAAVAQIEQANAMLDAKAQELQTLQQQIQQEGVGLESRKAALQTEEERLKSELKELELRKQLALKDLALAESKNAAVADAAVSQVQKLIADHEAQLLEMVRSEPDGDDEGAQERQSEAQIAAVLASHEQLMQGVSAIMQAMVANTQRPKVMQVRAPSGAVYEGTIQ